MSSAVYNLLFKYLSKVIARALLVVRVRHSSSHPWMINITFEFRQAALATTSGRGLKAT